MTQPGILQQSPHVEIETVAEDGNGNIPGSAKPGKRLEGRVELKPVDEFFKRFPANRTDRLAFPRQTFPCVDSSGKIVCNNGFRFFPGKHPEQGISDITDGGSSIEVAVDAEHTIAGLALLGRGDAEFQLVTG